MNLNNIICNTTINHLSNFFNLNLEDDMEYVQALDLADYILNNLFEKFEFKEGTTPFTSLKNERIYNSIYNSLIDYLEVDELRKELALCARKLTIELTKTYKINYRK